MLKVLRHLKLNTEKGLKGNCDGIKSLKKEMGKKSRKVIKELKFRKNFFRKYYNRKKKKKIKLN